jgi:hypothetical protein
VLFIIGLDFKTDLFSASTNFQIIMQIMVSQHKCYIAFVMAEQPARRYNPEPA